MLLYEDLHTYYLKLLDSGYTEEELLSLINKASIEYSKDNIEEDTLSNFLNPFFEVYSLKESDIEESRKNILENTLHQYFPKDMDNYIIIINHLLELSQYDKVIERNGINYFFLIDMLLANYILHFSALEAKKQSIKNDSFSVSKSSSTTAAVIISKEHNAVKTNILSMPNNLELKIRDEIYTEYERNPHSASTILHAVNLLGGIKSLTDEENQYILNSGIVIDCAFPFEIKEIYKSANILILLIFRKDMLWTKELKLEKNISNNRLIEINEVLMENIFETRNKLNKDNVSHIIQKRTDYNFTPLYEFRNPSNIKIHPAFEETLDNKKYWEELTEYFKKKIPLKSDDI